MAETVRNEEHAKDLLGDIVIRCRLRSLIAATGIAEFLQFLIVLPMLAFFPMSIPAVLLATELGAKPPLWEDPIGLPLVGGWWFACCGLIVASVIWRHGLNSLELREGGVIHNGQGIRFNEIVAICAGRPKSKVEKLFPSLSAGMLSLNPGAYAAQIEADSSVFTIICRDGSMRSIYHAPKFFERDDVIAFFTELKLRQPQYFLPPD